MYFERWPAQEHVYRDGAGAVGLAVHHGYGKKKVDNVAVIDRHERIERQIARLEDTAAKANGQITELNAEIAMYHQALTTAVPSIQADREAFQTALQAETSSATLRPMHTALARWEAWLDRTNDKVERLRKRLTRAEHTSQKAELEQERKRVELGRLAGRRKIFTVDTELDEIMTGFKLTFMNLCQVLMTVYLGQVMELETLIEAVLTLPGERHLTDTTETVRIYRRPRDPDVMAAVERACTAMNARALRRGLRNLRFELVEPPPRIRRVDRSD
jgi:hypothetical protein